MKNKKFKKKYGSIYKEFSYNGKYFNIVFMVRRIVFCSVAVFQDSCIAF